MSLPTRILLVSSIEKDIFIGELGKRLSMEGLEVYRYYIQTGKIVQYDQDAEALLRKGGSSSLSPFKVIWRALMVQYVINTPDVIHFHFIDILIPLIFKFLFPFKSTRYFATIWGGDFYKAAGWRATVKKLFYKRCEKITFTNAETEKAFIKINGSCCSELSTIRFGLVPLNFIEKEFKSSTKTTIRKNLGYDPDDFVIAVGTNSSENQNHFKIINALAKLPKQCKSDWKFIFPMGYPKLKEAYHKNVLKHLEHSGLKNYSIDEQFYNEEALAQFRLLPDILIQLQTTDQFSGAMQESLMAGCVVITGSWLPYDLLLEKGININMINNFEELPDVLIEAVRNPLNGDQKIANAKVIADLSVWDRVIIAWKALYN